MESPFANLFLLIMDRIAMQLAEIKHIDRNLGQLDNYMKRPEVMFPCVLVDFDGWTFTNLGDNTQQGEGTIVLYLAFARHLSSSNLTPEAYREMALEYDELEWQLHKAIQGWQPAEFVSPLSRVAANTLHNPLGVRLRPIKYHANIEDDSTGSQWITIPRPPIEITKTIEGNV